MRRTNNGKIYKCRYCPRMIFFWLISEKERGFKKEILRRKIVSGQHDYFCYPLIDHDQSYTRNGDRFLVSYGYENPRSKDQLVRLQEILRGVGKEHHLRVVHTRANSQPSERMIKLIISQKPLNDETWDKLQTHVFDTRYERVQ